MNATVQSFDFTLLHVDHMSWTRRRGSIATPLGPHANDNLPEFAPPTPRFSPSSLLHEESQPFGSCVFYFSFLA